ncbi:MAG: tetratricopeptide repeat protein [Bacteroidetes bacterium]|nr:tetratricopeptide repeat protein [Bacteroidota bacterium]
MRLWLLFFWANTLPLLSSAQNTCLDKIPAWHKEAQAARLDNHASLATELYTQIYTCARQARQPGNPQWLGYVDAALFLGAEALRAGQPQQAAHWMAPLAQIPAGDTLLLSYAQLLHNLAATYEPGNLAAAEALYLRALNIKLKVLPTEWETTVAQTFNNLAMVCVHQNKLDSAEYYMMRFAGITMQLQGERSFAAAQAYYSMTNVYLANHKWTDAHQVSTLALETLNNYTPRGDTLALITRLANNHALALIHLEKPQQAMKVIALMLKDLDDLKVVPNADFVYLYTTLGRSMEAQELYQKGLDYYQMAWETALATGVTTEHPWLRYNLARMHRLLLQDAQAEALLRQAAADKTLAPAVVTEYRTYLAKVLRENGKEKEAQKIERTIDKK